MKYQYLVTMIIPVYNGEEFIQDCLDCMVNQTIAKEKLEVLIVDDGSTDRTAQISQTYVDRYPNFRIISKENEGLSMTRNCGIKNARGRYLMYLDVDDTLNPQTIEKVTDFFLQHDDEVDLVSYPEIPVINGEPAQMHFRYDTLLYSGIYDLTDFDNAFITQTRINICVKNKGEDNVLFDFDREFRHEDQKYCTEILLEKMKIGYCSEGMYYYQYQPQSIVRTYFYAYYIFESTMRFWEEMFAKYEGDMVPYYLQALYIHDVNWKTTSDILLPYHYPAEKFDRATERILTLLNQVEDQIILWHPSIDNFHRQYYIHLKNPDDFQTLQSRNQIAVMNGNKEIIYSGKKMEIIVCKFQVKSSRIKMMAFVKSPVFNYVDKPRLYLVKNKDFNSKEELDLRLSSWSYYKTKNQTNSFYLFQLNLAMEELHSFELYVDIDGILYNTYYYFMYQVYFSHRYHRYLYIRENKCIKFHKNTFLISEATPEDYANLSADTRREYKTSNRKVWLIRNYCMIPRRKYDNIWLYCDCKGVLKDNGYYQYIHDFNIADSVKRYYVYNGDLRDIKPFLTHKQRKYLVRFGSWKHKYLYLKARKVITAYIEINNYLPFAPDWYEQYIDVGNEPELIYLQHGVLHAHVPWKYSLDRLWVEKEVISTTFEEKNLIQNYCFDEEHLIKSGMPRYDFIDTKASSVNRILFAPSWRKYLVGTDADGWVTTENKFIQSDFYIKTLAFLNDPALHHLLEKYDFYLDFKLHPIFERYRHFYSITNDRVTLAERMIEPTEYSIFMTDFSSFSFDFVYLKRPIVYFLPDDELFRAGMNDYRQIDLPFEDAFGDFVKEPEEAIHCLEKILHNGCHVEAKYAKRMDGFFFYEDNAQRDRIYDAIKDQPKDTQ